MELRLKLVVKGIEIEMSLQDAKELLGALKGLMGEKEYVPYPVYPSYPKWEPWITWQTTVGSTQATSHDWTLSMVEV